MKGHTMKRPPLLVSMLVAPGFAQADNGTLAATVTEPQTKNLVDVLTGPAGVSRPGFKACTRTDQVVVTSKVVAALGRSLKQNSEIRAASGGVAQ
jgi:hypothetical protein